MLSRPQRRAVDALVGNPFAPELDRAGAIRVLQGMDLRGLLAHPADEDQAERLMLAAAMAAAQQLADPAQLLRLPLFGGRVGRKLPRPASDYLRVAAAAVRAQRALSAIRGLSPGMQQVRRWTWSICFGQDLIDALELEQLIHDHDVLILGETGTGKEAVAGAILAGTPGGADCRPSPSATFNALAAPEGLVDSQLFGHVKGAFTGASDGRTGLIRTTHGGCFFLDEIGDLRAQTQVKLLRVMETNEVTPLGSDRAFPAATRYVAATHRDLPAMVERGEFRRDLFQRFAGSRIRIPPLRDRPQDIEDIGRAFIARYLGDDRSRPARRRAERWLKSGEARGHRWLGNVRELENALRNLLLGLDPALEGGADSAAVVAAASAGQVPEAVRDAHASMDSVRDWYVRRVLSRHDGNYAAAARVLGLDRGTVRRRAAPGEDEGQG